jgi:hypothetical protein
MTERDVRTERPISTIRGDTADTDPRARDDSAARERGNIPTQVAASETPAAAENTDVALLPDNRLGEFRTEWERIQIGFVDRPRESVKAAHDLVDRLSEELVQSFARQRETLEGGWKQGADDTEELRRSFQRYRSFFNRLLEA